MKLWTTLNSLDFYQVKSRVAMENTLLQHERNIYIYMYVAKKTDNVRQCPHGN